jgi:hypothetical protein
VCDIVIDVTYGTITFLFLVTSGEDLGLQIMILIKVLPASK